MEPYEELELRLAEWVGGPPENVVACASGSSALHLAFESLRLPGWAEVIMGDMNMIACPRAVTMADLSPVFVDCDDRLLVDLDLLDEAATGDARAVLVTHIYGRAADMGEAHAVAAKHGLLVVEDLAECHGVRPHGRSAAACWSFFKNKVVHGEEGGAACFRDPAHAALARRLRNMGFGEAHDYDHEPRGCNYRLANALALPILDSLARVEESLAARRQAEGWYDALCPDAWRMPPRCSVWNYDVRVPGLTRQRQGEVVKALNAAGVPARMSFLPMTAQVEYRHCRRVGGKQALAASESVFYLPAAPGQVTQETAERAFALLFSLLGRPDV